MSKPTVDPTSNSKTGPAVPVNFLATLDITGGNSGSAALNAKGELIGLAFDGTLDSIISDWDFNKANTRDIQVDLRYMLWNMKHVDKADNPLLEGWHYVIVSLRDATPVLRSAETLVIRRGARGTVRA